MNMTSRFVTRRRRSTMNEENFDLIELVNQLQNKLAASGHSLDISLPQIVVVGSQSAGKSSVLENVVGKEFLPRGTGVVTRRPTVVQLEPHDGEEYATFLHRGDEKFYDFKQVKDEILSETFRDPGPVGFSSKPISLKIYSPKVLKLTVVDLPGMIRVTVGDQSESCIEDVREMILQYIRQPNSLILAVTPANQDLASSDALEIAKTVDPLRIRTIGVLTKLDLMDSGTDARETLENKKIVLQRGYVGVLNRGQKDIEEGRDIQYCLEKEKHFFASMPCYKHIADRMGSPYLQKLLHQQLRTHIKETLPAMRKELSQKLNSFMQELKDIEEKLGCSESGSDGMQFYLIKLVQEFVENLIIEILGYSEKVGMDELSVGVLMNCMLCKQQDSLNSPKMPTEEQLLKIIANSHGIRNGIAFPSLALDAVNNYMIKQYIETLNRFVENIADFLSSNIEKIAEKMNTYLNLKAEITFEMRNVVDSAANETKNLLKKYMKAESFVNIRHPDFKFPQVNLEDIFHPLILWDAKKDSQKLVENISDYGGSNSSVNDSQIMENLVSNEAAKEDVNILAEMIEKYSVIQEKKIGDTFVKYIVTFLINEVMDFAKWKLLPIILSSANYDFLLEDCAKEFNRMHEIQITCDYLEEALNAIQNF